ncbi:MAG TPA: hypothetical protein VNE39_09310 [Planctomycetota bacterium]|nr:hypothetical protein [Planctomycetota bacterium]
MIFEDVTPALGDYWVAVGVPLNAEGNNDIQVEARDAVGRSGYDSVSVARDTQDPEVEITSPENNDKVHTRLITVSGTVSDATLYDVKVNGAPAEIDGETFTAVDVPLEAEGANTVTAVARDGVGHESESSITAVRSLPPVLAITSIVFSEQSTEEQAKVNFGRKASRSSNGGSAPLVLRDAAPARVAPLSPLGGETLSPPSLPGQPRNIRVPRLKIIGTVDDASASVCCGEVVGTNDGGEFVIDGVNVYAGTNILTVTATDDDGQSTSVAAVVDLDPGDGSYDLPGGGESGDVPPPPILTCTPLTVDEGGGEKMGAGGMAGNKSFRWQERAPLRSVGRVSANSSGAIGNPQWLGRR